MKTSKPEYALTPVVRAVHRRWQEALPDESFTDIAFTFELVMEGWDTGTSRAILD